MLNNLGYYAQELGILNEYRITIKFDYCADCDDGGIFPWKK